MPSERLLPIDARTLIAFADRLADSARDRALRQFRRQVAVERKADLSPVTEVDREIELELRRMIGETFPDHGVFGEEHGRADGAGPYLWVLDPIDGTKAYITGFPTFVTLIALCRNGRPVFGTIEAPATGDRWHGAEGVTTTLNGAPCRTSAVRDLAEASLYSTTWLPPERPGNRRIARLAHAVGLPRAGGDGYAYGLLASGLVDLVVDAGMQPYDYMALVPVIEGAGGLCTDWQGRPLDLGSKGDVLAAATPALHAAALDVLSA